MKSLTRHQAQVRNLLFKFTGIRFRHEAQTDGVMCNVAMKSVRDLFHRRDYTVLLVNEHKTSKVSAAACGSKCTKPASILTIWNPRPWRRAIAAVTTGAVYAQQYPYIVHGPLKCTGCARYWNRDVNGALSILIAATAAANDEVRPAYLQ